MQESRTPERFRSRDEVSGFLLSAAGPNLSQPTRGGGRRVVAHRPTHNANESGPGAVARRAKSRVGPGHAAGMAPSSRAICCITFPAALPTPSWTSALRFCELEAKRTALHLGKGKSSNMFGLLYGSFCHQSLPTSFFVSRVPVSLTILQPLAILYPFFCQLGVFWDNFSQNSGRSELFESKDFEFENWGASIVCIAAFGQG